jgi:hypothetical protein
MSIAGDLEFGDAADAPDDSLMNQLDLLNTSRKGKKVGASRQKAYMTWLTNISHRSASSVAPQQPQALLTHFAAPPHPVSCVERGSRLPRLRKSNRARALLAAAATTGIQAVAAFA